MLVVTLFKALCGIRPRYLQDCLSPIVSAHLTRFSRVGVVWVFSEEQCHLAGPRGYVFFLCSACPPPRDLNSPNPVGLLDGCKTLTFPAGIELGF